MRKAKTVLLVVLSLLFPALAVAGSAGAPGPVFEHIRALAFDAAGRVLWLGAPTGLYRTEDPTEMYVATTQGQS